MFSDDRVTAGFALLFFACVLLVSCFEIPPELPDDDGAAPDAHPPVTVYDDDPFAAKNRWFERAFKMVDPEVERAGRPSSGTAEPLASVDALETVDLAELIALSESALQEELNDDGGPAGGCGEQRARFVFRCDALALQAALGGPSGPSSLSRLDRELVRALDRFSREVVGPAVGLKGIDLECFNRPLPIRAGDWKQVWDDLPGGLLPAAKDLRWTTALRRETTGGRRESALVRHGVLRSIDGEPGPCMVASECWILERAGDEVKAAVWRFDRAASLAGEEPWRRLAPEEEFSIRDPLVANGEWLTGTTESLCLRCHGVGAKRSPAPLLPSTREAQLARVREILGDPGPGAGSTE